MTELLSKIIAASLSGVLEISIFHPVDTAAKRLMNNSNSNLSTKNIIFPDKNISKFNSLYSGVKFGMGYKILQRTYKYGGQSILTDKIRISNNKTINNAICGSMIGAGEIMLLPFDIFKIRMQTNPEIMKNKTVISLLKEEGLQLYRGSSITLLRNIPGSFALFGGNSFTKQYIFKVDNHLNATFYQNCISSIIGSVCSITVSSPMDVIKTRIQSNNNIYNYRSIILDIIKKEGFSAFYKGFVPKVTLIGPKLIFSFTIAQELMKRIKF
tara:strand:- start:1556 stop:2362 length:807 start_codon:yes stop_codon:yes gene_type:complete